MGPGDTDPKRLTIKTAPEKQSPKTWRQGTAVGSAQERAEGKGDNCAGLAKGLTHETSRKRRPRATTPSAKSTGQDEKTGETPPKLSPGEVISVPSDRPQQEPKAGKKEGYPYSEKTVDPPIKEKRTGVKIDFLLGTDYQLFPGRGPESSGHTARNPCSVARRGKLKVGP